MSESKIRDFLADNLALLDDSFTFRCKEYPLAEQHGASGFVDILATDKYGNFVIIELKRSNQAARQAITEVYKYAGLLKQNRYTQDSHIRIVIASTEWRELLVPFSELAKHSSYQVEGYRLTIDEYFRPVAATKVEPLLDPKPPTMISSHLIFCYSTALARGKGIAAIHRRLKKLDVRDYVVIEMEPHEIRPLHVYPYSAYLALKREPLAYYRTGGPNQHIAEKCETLQLEGYSEEIILEELESILLTQITSGLECDELDTGNLAMLTELLNSERWTTTHVSGNGFFSDKVIFDKERLEGLLTGETGDSNINFYDFGSSRSRARVDSVFNQLRKMFVEQPDWLSAIDAIARELSQVGVEYEFTTTVYSPPESVLETLHKISSYSLYGYETPFVFIPNFTIDVVYFDQAKTRTIYHGSIKWNGLQVDSAAFYRQVLKGKQSRIKVITDQYPRFEKEVMRKLNLFHGVDRVVVDPDGTLSVKSFPIHGDITLRQLEGTLLHFIQQGFECVQEVDQYLAQRTVVHR